MAAGRCRLCREVKDIRNSHYLPKGMFKFLRGEILKNPNPILTGRGATVQVSDQITGYMLCDECEDRFDRNGENLVVNKMARAGTFPLWEAIRAAKPIFDDGNTAIYAGGSIPGLNMDALVYFGMSVFWRGAACEWRDRRGIFESIKLGPYEERVRLFLLGKGGFPEDVALTITVSRSEKPIIATFTPSEAERQKYHVFVFYVPGIQFTLGVGKALSEEMKRACAFGAPLQPISASYNVDGVVKRALRWTIKDAFDKKGVDKTLQDVAAFSVKRSSKE